MRYPVLLRKCAPYGLLVVFVFLCFGSQIHKSVTVDEFCHLPSGIYNLVTFDWRMDRESPPLIKCLPAVGAMLKKPALNVRAFENDPNPWGFGYDFMYRNEETYHNLFVFGRMLIILAAAVGGFILYRFASQVYGYSGGIAVLSLYTFNPNVIAHSRLTTIDMGATATILLSVYLFWKFLQAPNLKTAALAGIGMGLAQLSKFTALIFIPIFCLIHLLSLSKKCLDKNNQDESIKAFALRNLGYMVFSICTALIVINTGYLFSGSFASIEKYRLESNLLRTVQSHLWKELPVPLPYDYVAGFDMQLAISQGGNPFYMGYLMGNRSLEGWWHYYLVAFAVKNPLALCILFCLAVVLWIKDKKNRPDFETCLCIWVPMGIFFAYFSLFTKIPIGVRFLLPIFPLCFMMIGYIWKSSLLRGKVKGIVLCCFVGGYIVSTIAAFPNYLSYFTYAIGGPKEGHQWLIDGNIDLGQDLPRLKKYMDENRMERINLGYFGRVDPKIYGIDYTLAEPEAKKGPCALSINFIVGRPYYLLDSTTKRLTYIDHEYYKSYRDLKPLKTIGHSIYVYDIKDEDLAKIPR